MPPTGWPWPRLANHRPRCRRLEPVGNTLAASGRLDSGPSPRQRSAGGSFPLLLTRQAPLRCRPLLEPAAVRSAKHRLCSSSFPLTPCGSLAAQPPNLPQGDEAWPPRRRWFPRVGQYCAVGPRRPDLPLGWATTGSAVGRSIKPARCQQVAAPNESVHNSYRLSHNGQLPYSSCRTVSTSPFTSFSIVSNRTRLVVLSRGLCKL